MRSVSLAVPCMIDGEELVRVWVFALGSRRRSRRGPGYQWGWAQQATGRVGTGGWEWMNGRHGPNPEVENLGWPASEFGVKRQEIWARCGGLGLENGRCGTVSLLSLCPFRWMRMSWD